MNKRRIIFTIGFIVLISSLIWASSSGPIDGVTGAPGDENCAICHSSPIEPAQGILEIFVSSRYQAGESLDITVRIMDATMIITGFEATVLDSDNMPVGQLIMIDEVNTQFSQSPSGRQYIKHTFEGNNRGQILDQMSMWSFRWDAPNEDAGVITFYAASVAGNYNGNPFSDYVYTQSASVIFEDPNCCIGDRGNADGDLNDITDVDDLVYMVNFAFKGGPGVACLEEGDVDASGNIDVDDLVFMVNFAFKGGPAPGPCNVK